MFRASTRPSLAAAAAALVLGLSGAGAAAQDHQEHVHDMAHGVMPFDIDKAMHYFGMTTSGGVQRVVLRDGTDSKQIALIRQHLRMEAQRFQNGDYSDPATLHGATMPGLAELQGGAQGIKVSYADLPTGGAISFATPDPRLVTAIHRWFGAQLSEHGADARAE